MILNIFKLTIHTMKIKLKHDQVITNDFVATVVILTKYPKVGNLLQGPPEIAAWLEAASIGINVYVAHRLLDPNAETQGTPREGVEDIYKMSIVWREAPVGMFALKVWSSWIQSYRQRKGVSKT